jgi:acyl-CoA reductase-like NAD-dependent aldehyde dehydrogenase
MLKEQAKGSSLISAGTLAAAYAGAKPVAERLLYDDDLRDNLRVFIESARTIVDELSGEDPSEIVGRLWDDDKLRKQVEAAAGAAQEGTKRVRGQKVRQGGGGRRFFFLLLLAAIGFLFLSPQTGPQARNLAKQAYGSITGD